MDTKRTMHRFLPVRNLLIVLVLVWLLAWILIPNFVRGGPGRLTGVINTLRQIDAAKQQWAYEHGITNTAQCTNNLTETDLTPYLGGREDRVDRRGFGFDRSGRPPSGVGEKYVINPLTLSPEAYLTREFNERRDNAASLPKGTIIRLSNPGHEVILPDGAKLPR